MRVDLQDGDGHELRRRIGSERAALPRDRCRVVLLAAEGVGGVEQSREQIAAAVGRSRQFVDEWARRYRRRGLAGLTAGKAKGNRPTLTAEELARFKARIEAGPGDADGNRSALRGKQAMQILAAEFGKPVALSTAYKLLHDAGLSCLRPRPRHRKNDPAKMAAWLDRAPLLSSR